MVPRKQGFLLRQRIGEMIRRVSGRLDGSLAPAGAGDRIRVPHLPVRGEGAVGGGVEHPLLARAKRAGRAVRTAADDPGAGRGLQRRHCGRMVAMGVGHHDMAHRLAVDRGQQACHVPRIVRPGVDDGDRPAADDVTAGTGERHRAAVTGDDPAHERGQFGDLSGRRRLRPVECDVVAHDPVPDGWALGRALPLAEVSAPSRRSASLWPFAAFSIDGKAAARRGPSQDRT